MLECPEIVLRNAIRHVLAEGRCQEKCKKLGLRMLKNFLVLFVMKCSENIFVTRRWNLLDT